MITYLQLIIVLEGFSLVLILVEWKFDFIHTTEIFFRDLTNDSFFLSNQIEFSKSFQVVSENMIVGTCKSSGDLKLWNVDLKALEINPIATIAEGKENLESASSYPFYTRISEDGMSCWNLKTKEIWLSKQVDENIKHIKISVNKNGYVCMQQYGKYLKLVKLL